LGADKKFFAKKKRDIYPLNETRATSTFAKKNVSYIPIQLNAVQLFPTRLLLPVKVTQHAVTCSARIDDRYCEELKREKHLTKLLPTSSRNK